MKKTTSGFTIVELLIVIVVIAILAAITIVAYNGIQSRTRISIAQADLSNLAKQAKLYYVDNGAYPTSSAAWKTVFQNANLYDQLGASKTFGICATTQAFAIEATAPLTLSEASGSIHYQAHSDKRVTSFAWDSSITGTYYLDRSCGQPAMLPSRTFTTWANQL